MRLRVPEAQVVSACIAMAARKAGVPVEDLSEHARTSAVGEFSALAEAAVSAVIHPPLPHNLDAEQALLGAVLFDNGSFERLPDSLSPEDFHEPYHQRLFAAVVDCIRQGMMADPVLLSDRLRGDPAFEAFGGLRYLADLMDRAPPGAVAPDYARSLIETSQRRRMIAIGDALVHDAWDPDVDAEAVAETAEADLFRAMARGGSSRAVMSFSDALTGALEMVAAAYGRDGGLSGLATHLDDLDSKLGGLHPSDLLIVAGRPSMGKTALATNIAFNIARNYRWTPDPDAPGGRRTTAGGRVQFFSLEMSGEQLALRILADASGVSGDRLRKGEIDPSEYGQVRDAASEIVELPLYIDATGGLAIAKLAARARRQARTTGLDLIVVDYLQLITTPGARRDANRVEQVSEITGALKALAKELGVPIIALSQLSRQVEQREDKRPMLSDLRESGSIEQDADCVMFVYREAYYLERAEPKDGTPEHLAWQEDLSRCQGQAEAIIGKQRHGPIGTVRLAFDGDRTRFSNLAHGQTAGGYHDPSTPRSNL